MDKNSTLASDIAYPYGGDGAEMFAHFWECIYAPHIPALVDALDEPTITLTAEEKGWGDVAAVSITDSPDSMWKRIAPYMGGSVSITPVIWPTRTGRRRVADSAARPGAIVALYADVDVYDPAHPNTHAEGDRLPDEATARAWIEELADDALVVATGGGYHVWEPLAAPVIGEEAIRDVMRRWAWAWTQVAARDGKSLDIGPLRNLTTGLRMPGVGYSKRTGVQATIVQDPRSPRDSIDSLPVPPEGWRIGMTSTATRTRMQSAAQRLDALGQTDAGANEWEHLEYVLGPYIAEMLQSLLGATVRGNSVWMSHPDGWVNDGTGSGANSSITESASGESYILVLHGTNIIADLSEEGFGRGLSALDLIALALIRRHGIEGGKGRARGLARGIVERVLDGDELDLDVLSAAIQNWAPSARRALPMVTIPAIEHTEPSAVLTHIEAPDVPVHEEDDAESRPLRDLVSAGEVVELTAGDRTELRIVVGGPQTGVYALVPKPMSASVGPDLVTTATACLEAAKFEFTSAKEARRAAERAASRGESGAKKALKKAVKAFDAANSAVASETAALTAAKAPTRMDEDGVELVPRRLTSWVSWPLVQSEGRLTADGELVPSGRRRIQLTCVTADGRVEVQQGHAEELPRTLEGYSAAFPTAGLLLPVERDRQLMVMNGLRALAREAASTGTSDTTPTSMGWARLAAGWTYLTPRGSVSALGIQHVTLRSPGADELHTSVAHLGHERLPDCDDASALRELLALTTGNQALQLLAYTAAAVLPETRRPSLLLHAETDSGKTMLVCVLLALLGDANPLDQPVSMSLPADNSKAGASALMRFARHSMLVLDDYRASETPDHARATATIVSTAVQATAGAIAGVKSNTARGLAESQDGGFSTIVTAEQLPESGVAILNRSLLVRLRKGDFLMSPMGASPLDEWVAEWALTGRANAVWAGYLQWLASRLDELGLGGFRADVQRRRSAATSKLNRMDVSAGLLIAGMSLLREYLATLGTDDILPPENEVAEAVAEMVADTAAAAAAEDPAVKVIAYLRREVEAGRMRLSGPVPSQPPAAAPDLPASSLLGWRGGEPNTYLEYLGRTGTRPENGERVIAITESALDAARQRVCPTTTARALRDALRKHECLDLDEHGEVTERQSRAHGLDRPRQGGRSVFLAAPSILPEPAQQGIGDDEQPADRPGDERAS